MSEPEKANECTVINGDIRHTLMTEWWEHHPDAGPKEPTNPLTTTETPILTCLAWANGKPCVPEDIMKKFSDDSDYFESWSSKIESVTQALATLGKTELLSSHQQPPQPRHVYPDYTHDPPATLGDLYLKECTNFKMDSV